MQSSVSCFGLQHPLVSLTLSYSCLTLLPRLPLTSNIPSFFTVIKWFRRRFPRNVWPIKFAFLPFVDSIQYFISHTISPADLRRPSPKHFSNRELPGLAVSLLQQQSLIFSSPIFTLLLYCTGAAILTYPCERTNITPFTSTILLPADDNLYGTSEKAPSDLRPRTYYAYLTCETLHSWNISVTKTNKRSFVTQITLRMLCFLASVTVDVQTVVVVRVFTNCSV